MTISIAGIAVSGVLLIVLLFLRGGLLAGLLGSLAFGSTAIATLNSLGGSSPLIYVGFTIAFIMASFLRRDLLRRLGTVFLRIKASWIVLAFMTYAAFSALLLPRLFAGATNVFVTSREKGGVFETPLAPVSGNISQAGYLMVSCITFFAVCVLLIRRFRLDDVRRGFFLFAWMNAILGITDFVGKYSGLGDILAPIRSANYAMLTNVELAGFSRIAGGFSEASAFGGISLACLAFSYTYWRRQNSRQAFWLTAITIMLLLASTSTTAYAGLAILCVPVAFSIARKLASRYTTRADLFVVSVLVVALTAIMAIGVVKPQALAPVADLIDGAILSKGTSDSGQERAYWNAKSLESLAATAGLGVGLGSSRASSWPIAVISQLGVIGFFLTVLMVMTILRGMHGLPRRLEPSADATLASVRACALAGIVSSSLIDGNADPGIVFFIALGVIAVSRVYIVKNTRSSIAGAGVRDRWTTALPAEYPLQTRFGV